MSETSKPSDSWWLPRQPLGILFLTTLITLGGLVGWYEEHLRQLLREHTSRSTSGASSSSREPSSRDLSFNKTKNYTDARKLGIRVGSNTGGDYLVIQFFEGEEKYSIKVTLDQAKTIVDAYRDTKEEYDFFAYLEEQMSDIQFDPEDED